MRSEVMGGWGGVLSVVGGMGGEIWRGFGGGEVGLNMGEVLEVGGGELELVV